MSIDIEIPLAQPGTVTIPPGVNLLGRHPRASVQGKWRPKFPEGVLGDAGAVFGKAVNFIYKRNHICDYICE
jgi:hypothetical protein